MHRRAPVPRRRPRFRGATPDRTTATITLYFFHFKRQLVRPAMISSSPTSSSSPAPLPAVVLACRGAPGADLNLVRALGRDGVPVIVVGEYPFPPSGYSRHCIEFICARDFTQHPRRLLKVLRELRMRHGQALPVFASADPDLRVMAELHAELVGTALWLSSSPDMIARLQDQRRFAELALQHDLPVPALHAPRTLEEVEALGRTLAYPVVVKPARAGCWHRPGIDPALSRCRAVQVEDAQALMRLCCQLAPHGLELVIQDRVPGDVDQQWTVHACIARGGTPVALATTRTLRNWPADFGPACHLETVAMPALEAEARAMLQRLKLRGMVSMNFRRDPHTGRMWLLEINPRASGASLLLARAGLNLPARVHREVCGRPPLPETPWRTGLRYRHGRVDLRAFLVRRRQGRELLLRGLLSMLHPRTVFRAFDPADMGPPVQMTLDWLLGKLRGSGRWVWSRLGPGAA